MVHTITVENTGFELALVQWGLRHELPDQQVLDHPIIAIAPLVTMSCRLLLRRVASRGVLPRERFSPFTLSGQSGRLRGALRRGAASDDVSVAATALPVEGVAIAPALSRVC